MSRAFSSCPDSQRGEGTDALAFLASASQWVDVLSVLRADRDGAGEDAFADATVTTPDGQRTVAVHRSFWPGLDWALAHGGRVEVALPRPGDYTRDDTVMAAIAITSSGHVFFPGDCQEETFREPLRARFGAALDAQLTGLSHRPIAQVRHWFTARPEPAEVTDATRILNPQDAPASLLASLEPIAVHVTVDRATGAGTTICTRIRQGWNDCVVPDAAAASTGVTVSGYLDASRRLEVWLLDGDADVTKPGKRLGVVDVGDAHEAHVDVQLTGRTAVTLRDR